MAWQTNAWLLVFVTLINSFWGLTNLPVLYINKMLIDVVIAAIGGNSVTASIRTVFLLIVVRSIIELSRSFLTRLNNVCSNQLASRMNAKIEVILGEKLNSLDVPTVESPAFQDKYKKIDRQYNSRAWGMISPLSEFPNAIFTIISSIVPIFSFQPLIALFSLVAVVPQGFVNSKNSRADYEAEDKLSKDYRIWGWINYIIRGSNTLYENIILGNTGYLSKQLSVVADKILTSNYKRRLKRAHLRNLADIPAFLVSIGLNTYFFALAIMGKVSLGTAQMLYQASNSLGNGFSMMFNNISQVYEDSLFMTDFTWFMDLQPLNQQGKITPQKTFKRGVVFDNVWFKYPSSRKWILKSVSLEVGPKDNVALVGENGAGKTTLLKLLCGLYQPSKGKITVNGISVDQYKYDKYHKILSVLFQDFSTYPFSARESIGYGDIDKIDDLASIELVAKQTDVHGFINKLPNKYETPLTKELEGGLDPSKGQWQRIGLSRALLRDSKIVILDEPTSNVDSKAEEDIFKKLLKIVKDKILILVSHRFSTVRRADKILLLDNGKITEQGSHEQLMKLDGKYAHLFNLQAKSYQ